MFLVESDEGVTGLVLLGDGVMRFTPGPDSEQGQLRLFAGTESLTAAFDRAFVRLNPFEYTTRVPADALRAVTVDAGTARRAEELVEREMTKSSPSTCARSAATAGICFRKRGTSSPKSARSGTATLTFSRFGAQAEDISLIDRERRLTIALYSSPDNLAARGRFYSDDLQREYDVVDYDIEASVRPSRRFLRARARLDDPRALVDRHSHVAAGRHARR